MAAPVIRTATDEITDALRAVDDVQRYATHVRQHLYAALALDPHELEGTLAQAARVSAITAGCAHQVHDLIQAARRAA